MSRVLPDVQTPLLPPLRLVVVWWRVVKCLRAGAGGWVAAVQRMGLKGGACGAWLTLMVVGLLAACVRASGPMTPVTLVNSTAQPGRVGWGVMGHRVELR